MKSAPVRALGRLSAEAVDGPALDGGVPGGEAFEGYFVSGLEVGDVAAVEDDDSDPLDLKLAGPFGPAKLFVAQSALLADHPAFNSWNF